MILVAKKKLSCKLLTRKTRKDIRATCFSRYCLSRQELWNIELFIWTPGDHILCQGATQKQGKQCNFVSFDNSWFPLNGDTNYIVLMTLI